MIRRALFRIPLLCLLCFVCAFCSALAEEDHRDITEICEFQIGPLVGKAAVLLDGNPTTIWTNGTKGGQYLQIYKPGGIATLSVLWVKPPRGVSLRHGVNGQFTVLKYYGETDPLLETILLPMEAGVYFLCGSEGMSIAEIRVHSGELKENFFTAHGYPPGATCDWPAERLRRPLRRSDTGQQVYEMKETLTSLGYSVGKLDRKFTEADYLALISFQRACGLYPTGVLDLATLDALASPPPGSDSPLIVQPAWPRTASALVRFVRSKLGAGYLYGASGKICSPSYRAATRDIYPEYTDVINSYAYLWDGGEVYDCIGLFKAFLRSSAGEFDEKWSTNVNGSVTRWMTTPEPLATMPREPGIFLLQQNPTNEGFMHVGLYIGGGVSIHARGHRYGVVADPMPQLWTHWARASWLTYDLPEEPYAEWPVYMGEGERVLVDTASGNALNVYRRPQENMDYWIRVRVPNYTEITIEEIPAGAPYWRIVTVPDTAGKLHTGYVFAKDLSVLDPPLLPGK